MAKRKASRTQGAYGDNKLHIVSTPRRPAASIIHRWVTINSLRRFNAVGQRAGEEHQERNWQRGGRKRVLLHPFGEMERPLEIAHQKRRGVIADLEAGIRDGRGDPDSAEDRVLERAPVGGGGAALGSCTLATGELAGAAAAGNSAAMAAESARESSSDISNAPLECTHLTRLRRQLIPPPATRIHRCDFISPRGSVPGGKRQPERGD